MLCKFLLKGMTNVVDPSFIPTSLNGGFSQELATEITNCITKTPNGVRMRQGYTQVLPQSCHSGWSDGEVAYFVCNSQLYSFNGSTTKFLVNLSNNTKTCFCKVNDVVVMSNGTDYLIIQDEVVYDPEKDPREFKVLPPPAQALAFYNGRLYLGVNNVLYCTDTFTVETCDSRQMGIDSYRDDVTLIGAVDDGLYVGTENELFFYHGNDPYNEGSFTKKRVGYFGAIGNTVQTISGQELSSINVNGKAIIFASTRGICVGANSGNVLNLSEGVMDYAHDNIGCSVIREESGEKHYIAAFQRKYSEENVYVKPSFDVDDETI